MKNEKKEQKCVTISLAFFSCFVIRVNFSIPVWRTLPNPVVLWYLELSACRCGHGHVFNIRTPETKWCDEPDRTTRNLF
jgi:hypothetical protein